MVKSFFTRDISFAWLLLISGAVFISCSHTSKEVEEKEQSPRLQGLSALTIGSENWNAYLKVMSESEVRAFHALPEDQSRSRFIQTHGIDVRHEMNDRLRKGMSQAMVLGALEDLYDSQIPSEEKNKLYFRVYNGQAYTNMYCVFAEGFPGERAAASEAALVDWGSYTDQASHQEEPILSVERVLREKLGRVLRSGMGPEEITTSYQQAEILVERYQQVMRDKVESEDFAKWHAPSLSDYDVWAEWIRAQGIIDFYEVLNRRPDKKAFEGNSEYWYFWLPYEEDETIRIVIEYRFRFQQLQSWYVYHRDSAFLGSE